MQAIERGAELDDMTLEDLRSFSTLIEEDVFAALSLEQTIATKSQAGSCREKPCVCRVRWKSWNASAPSRPGKRWKG